MWCSCPWLKSTVVSGKEQSGQKPQTITFAGSPFKILKSSTVLYFQFWSVQRQNAYFPSISQTFKHLNGQKMFRIFNKLTWHLYLCVFSLSRSKPAEEPTAGSIEEGTDITPTSWLTSPDTELELEDPENTPGLGGEELPHMLLPDSLSQLEEFGRHKRPRKVHRGHGRPRLFSDLWVRIGDRWDIYYDYYTITILLLYSIYYTIYYVIFSSSEDVQLSNSKSCYFLPYLALCMSEEVKDGYWMLQKLLDMLENLHKSRNNHISGNSFTMYDSDHQVIIYHHRSVQNHANTLFR